MIKYLDPDNRYYTDRSYLTEWFYNDDTLVVTDNDFENPNHVELLTDKKYVLDITHNPSDDFTYPAEKNAQLILTNNFKFWYHPGPKRVFFPLFLWLYSLRKSVTDFLYPGFDAGNNKTQGIMCLNKNSHKHRIWLWNEFNRRNLIDSMMFTFVGHRNLPGETPEFLSQLNDVGVGHAVYGQYAVNLVTETVVHLPYLSEKSCKPFIARQIPIIVGGAGSNKFLQDIGLDMFEDLIPWSSWDSEVDSIVRMQKIAEFVEQWIRSGNVLSDYQRVIDRVERNKQYFHSEAFRNIIMQQMSAMNTYK